MGFGEHVDEWVHEILRMRLAVDLWEAARRGDADHLGRMISWTPDGTAVSINTHPDLPILLAFTTAMRSRAKSRRRLTMRTLVSLIAVLACLTGIAGTARAQTATGQITGTVTDTSGAVMPRSRSSSRTRRRASRARPTTNDCRRLRRAAAAGRAYLVTAEQAGFKLAVQLRDPVERRPGRSASTCSSRRVTSPSPSRCAATPSSIDTETSAVGQVISEGRSPSCRSTAGTSIQLLFLGAGAVETDGEQAAMRQGVGDAISIMGSRPTSNNFMIDGTSNVDTSLGTPAAILSIDIIQEFKEQTATYSAEYGFSANQINIVSKSGTNDVPRLGVPLHPQREAGREELLRPRDAPKPKLDQKQPGLLRRRARVRLPFYDGRNKTFFLFNYEATRIERGAELVLHRAVARRVVRTLQHDDHRSDDRTAVPEQHDPAGALVAARPAGGALVARAEHRTPRRATTR